MKSVVSISKFYGKNNSGGNRRGFHNLIRFGVEGAKSHLACREVSFELSLSRSAAFKAVLVISLILSS
jgi:hypothetical protein